MFKIHCRKCSRELDQPGALLITPPTDSPQEGFGFVVRKYHLCLACYLEVTDFINQGWD